MLLSEFLDERIFFDLCLRVCLPAKDPMLVRSWGQNQSQTSLLTNLERTGLLFPQAEYESGK